MSPLTMYCLAVFVAPPVTFVTVACAFWHGDRVANAKARAARAARAERAERAA